MLKSLDDRLARSAATVSQRLTMLVERLIVDAIQRQDEALTKVSVSACQHVILETDSTKREPTDRQIDGQADGQAGRETMSSALWCRHACLVSCGVPALCQ